MKYDKVKTAADIRLEGVTVEVDYVDKNISAITLTDAAGNVVRFERSNSYTSLDVMVKAKPVMVRRWRVEATILGAKSTWMFLKPSGSAYNLLMDRLRRLEDEGAEFIESEIEVEEEDAPSVDPDTPF